jgi:hypothetical protein
MDNGGIDERLREVYESSAPSVDEPAFATRLRRKSMRRQMLPAPRHRVRHPWLVAASSMLVAVALVVGTYEAVIHLGKERAILVITDDSMRPSGASSYSTADIRLRYGQIASIDGLEIAITVEPTPAPFTEADPSEILSSLSSNTSGKRLRSQFIVTNTGPDPLTFNTYDLGIPAKDGLGYYRPVGHNVDVQPGATVAGRVDWYVGSDVSAESVAYAPGDRASSTCAWGPDSITSGPGYPVLKVLPELRAEDVESEDVYFKDNQGNDSPKQTLTPANDLAGIQKLIQVYQKTTLVPSEGYPTYQMPVHIVLHLKDGTDFSLWIGTGPDRCMIQDTRGITDGNPSAATGSNSALLSAFYLEGYGEGGATISPPSDTATTTMVAPQKTLAAGSKTISAVNEEIFSWAAALHVSGISVYLPSAMPSGWGIAEQGAHLNGTGGTDNPAMWKTAGGGSQPPVSGSRSAGYGLTFTNGKNELELQLNYPGDLGQVAWKDSGVKSTLGGTLKLARTGSMVIVLIPTPDDLPLYVWGDPSLETEALALAKEVTEWAKL